LDTASEPSPYPDRARFWRLYGVEEVMPAQSKLADFIAKHLGTAAKKPKPSYHASKPKPKK
jgi:hypothetical protein